MKKILITFLALAIVQLNISHTLANPSTNDRSTTLINPSSFSIAYPRMSLYKREEGTVIIKVTVDKTGRVQNAAIKESSNYSDLDQSALRSVKALAKFNPAIKNGMPVASTVIIPISFRLEAPPTAKDRVECLMESAKQSIQSNLLTRLFNNRHSDSNCFYNSY